MISLSLKALCRWMIPRARSWRRQGEVGVLQEVLLKKSRQTGSGVLVRDEGSSGLSIRRPRDGKRTRLST